MFYRYSKMSYFIVSPQFIFCNLRSISVSVMFGRLILVDMCSSVLLVLIAAWCPLCECTTVYLFISYSWKCRCGLILCVFVCVCVWLLQRILGWIFSQLTLRYSFLAGKTLMWNDWVTGHVSNTICSLSLHLSALLAPILTLQVTALPVVPENVLNCVSVAPLGSHVHPWMELGGEASPKWASEWALGRVGPMEDQGAMAGGRRANCRHCPG